MSVTVLTLITEALQELNVYQLAETLGTNEKAAVLSKLNQLFDLWNADRQTIWSEIFTQFTLTANLSPHTIGASAATWTMAIRPVTLDGCDLVLNTNTPDVFTPIDIIDYQTYKAISVPGIATSIPTSVYYEPDWPLGKLYFFPIPDYAYNVRLATRTLLATVGLSDTVTFPPGYQIAITLTLAEWIAPTFGATVMPKTEQLARDARALIFGNNNPSPSLNLQDGQQQSGRMTTYNFHNRSL